MKNIILLYAIISAFQVNAQSSLISTGSLWSYYDNENEPADQASVKWYDNTYDDSSWASGNAQLGYGDGDEETVINSDTKVGYFRQNFEVLYPNTIGNLIVNLTYDDGAVVYLNGAELWRVNMPGGTISYSTYAAGGSSDNKQVTEVFAQALIMGTNTIAVEVHQVSSSSSDISFDLNMEGGIPGSVSLLRGPYLQKASPSAMTLKWRTASPTESVVNFGTSLGNLSQQASELTLKTEHEIRITGLQAETVYYYELANSTTTILASEAELFFKTSPTLGSDDAYKFWILGDPGTANNNQRAVRDAYYTYAGSSHTDGILFLGDNAYSDGTDSEYQSAIFENMYEDQLRNTIAWSCLGNHDGHSADSDSQTGPYFEIFSFPTSGESGGLASGTEAYYSFDYGNIHFICLDSYDSNRSVGGTMYNWAISDIQNTTQQWIVAYWHHPPYTKGSHDSDSESNLVQMRENFLPMLEMNGVDLVLSGHSHSYERSYFLNGHYGNSNSFSSSSHTVGSAGNGDGRSNGGGAYQKYTLGAEAGKGAVYITTGSAGKISSASLDHEAMYYSVAELGSCVLEVQGNQLDVKFLRETGNTEDYFSIIKQVGCSPSIESNTYIGDDQIWHNTSNWSTGKLPTTCTEVIISNNATVKVPDNEMIRIKALDLKSGSNLMVGEGSELIISEQDPE